MTGICVTLGEKGMEENLSLLERCRDDGAEMVEIRLDLLDTVDISGDHISRIRDAGLRSLITFRPEDQGGMFGGSEKARFRTLMGVIEIGPDMIDIELKMDKEYRQRIVDLARERDVGVIISHHFRDGSPSMDVVRSRLIECLEAGADMAKVVTHTSSLEDLFGLLETSSSLKRKGLVYSLMGTGPFGHLSRILSREMGSELVYCCLDDPLAEGQVRISDLMRIRDHINVGCCYG